MPNVNDINFTGAKVAIIGDGMTDEYWHCTSTRVSPEAPVPVCNLVSKENRHGGAFNVMACVGALGAEVKVLCAQHFDGAIEHKKIRVVVGRHQVSRIDMLPDPERYVATWRSTAMQHAIIKAVKWADVVIVSDYGHMPAGIIRYTLHQAQRHGVLTVADPKRPDGHLYRGANYLTPNAAEWRAMGGKYSKKLHEAVLVTQGEHGMTLMQSPRKQVHFPTMARDVVDVTGAGDTVVAVLAVALASGYQTADAVRLANIAAGIACEHFGTYPVPIEEIKQRVGAKP